MSSHNSEDPFLQVQADVLSALENARPLFKSYLRIRSSASSATSPELREARGELEQTLQDLSQDLEDMVESVKVVENDPYRFGLEIDEVERRRKLVKDVGYEIENMRDELQQTVQHAKNKGKSTANGDMLPDPDSFEEEDTYAALEHERQMEMMHEQDEALDGVFRTVGNLRQQADDMGRELEEQGELLTDVDNVADRVGGKLQTGLKKVGYVIRKNEGMTFAAFALGASIVLLGILANVSRPFEAHLFNHGYQSSIEVYSQPYAPEMSHSEIASHDFRAHLESQRRSRSSYEVNVSNLSNVGVNRIIPDNRSSLSSPPGPFTVQSPETGVFTSKHAPPPIPAAYITPRRNSLPGNFPSASQPLNGHNTVDNTSRSPEADVNKRQSLPAPFSPSTWQAVHPNPESLALVSHSRSDVANARISYQNPYSRSSISLTRPKRLSYTSAAPSVSSRTEHTDSDSQDESSSRANSSEIARAISKAIPMPMATHPSNRRGNIQLVTSFDNMSRARKSYHIPHMTASTAQPDHDGPDDKYEISTRRYESHETPPNSHRNYVRSTSPGFLSLFSPDSSPTEDKHYSPPKETSVNRVPRKPVPPPRGPSPSKLMAAEAAAAMLINMPDDLPIPEHHTRPPKRLPSAKRAQASRKSWVYEQVKNKPLPRIAFL
ncbi:hypothetical protein yc1106_00273 [Curvularia clavata]|uniref:t-SNARE affecting a late Golgi compartment protein 1 n=1 Tax=Curvularia clavata TaxID=95742 RepID=A0A9Q9DNW2_CURCL|nr:hypothetical protein yc1106_00273 [Curvularia clavata]